MSYNTALVLTSVALLAFLVLVLGTGGMGG
jgi:hypothetical protein